MYRSVKITEGTYREAKKLAMDLGRENEAAGRIGISNAIAHAIHQALEARAGRRRMLSAVGGWSDIDGEKILKEIYEGRLMSTRPEPRI